DVLPSPRHISEWRAMTAYCARAAASARSPSLNPTDAPMPLGRSVAIAGSERLLKGWNVGLRIWIAHYLLSNLPSLTGRPGEELLQPGLHLGVGGESRGNCRVLRVQCRHELVVSAGCVDGRTQIGIGGRDPSPGGQRQCQTTNHHSKFDQRQFGHVSLLLWPQTLRHAV